MPNKKTRLSVEDTHQDTIHVSLPSFSSVIVILPGLIIFFLAPRIGKSLAIVLLVLLGAVVLWQAFSSGQYKKMQQTYPEMQRSFWIINNLVYLLAIPSVFFAAAYCLYNLVIR